MSLLKTSLPSCAALPHPHLSRHGTISPYLQTLCTSTVRSCSPPKQPKILPKLPLFNILDLFYNRSEQKILVEANTALGRPVGFSSTFDPSESQNHKILSITPYHQEAPQLSSQNLRFPRLPMAVLVCRGHRWPGLFSWGDNPAPVTREPPLLTAAVSTLPAPGAAHRGKQLTALSVLHCQGALRSRVTSLGRCSCPRKHSSAGGAGGSPPGRSRCGLMAAAKGLLAYKGDCFYWWHTSTLYLDFPPRPVLQVSQLPFHSLPLFALFLDQSVWGFSLHVVLLTELCRQTQDRVIRKCGLEPCPALCDKHRELRQFPSVSPFRQH